VLLWDCEKDFTRDRNCLKSISGAGGEFGCARGVVSMICMDLLLIGKSLPPQQLWLVVDEWPTDFDVLRICFAGYSRCQDRVP
jgi:hypothetical protein